MINLKELFTKTKPINNDEEESAKLAEKIFSEMQDEKTESEEEDE